MAGVEDCYTRSTGNTKTKGNFLFATYNALAKTYKYLTPNFWGQPPSSKDLVDENVDTKEIDVEDDM